MYETTTSFQSVVKSQSRYKERLAARANFPCADVYGDQKLNNIVTKEISTSNEQILRRRCLTRNISSTCDVAIHATSRLTHLNVKEARRGRSPKKTSKNRKLQIRMASTWYKIRRVLVI